MSRRMDRVNVLLRQKLSEIIAHEMKDPRLTPIITITHVEVSPDLSYAKVFASTMGTSQEGRAAMEALSAASGFLRRELRSRLTLRNVPYLRFVADDSLEMGQRLLQRIQEVRSQDVPEEGQA
ncbi:MAG: 30S ribosome-binding factor RbfA [Chloroflexi bacterium]|nr:30S ribosome-binding factor RbfA [Chloroflexota bacterium]